MLMQKPTSTQQQNTSIHSKVSIRDKNDYVIIETKKKFPTIFTHMGESLVSSSDILS